jgi:hypothetical protein
MKKYLFIAAALMLSITAVASAGDKPPKQEDKDPHKVYVCKYVGTPGEDERLQEGGNPIEVDSHALEGDGFAGTFPFEFSDAHGKSVAIGWSGDGYPVLDIGNCPTPDHVEPDCSGDYDSDNNGPNGDCTDPKDPEDPQGPGDPQEPEDPSGGIASGGTASGGTAPTQTNAPAVTPATSATQSSGTELPFSL